MLLLLLPELLQYWCVHGNTPREEGLRLVYMSSSQHRATGAAGPARAGFGERQEADVLLMGSSVQTVCVLPYS